MSRYLHDRIIPYKGIQSFKFGDSIQSVREELKSHKIPFNQSMDPNKGCTPEIPWTFIEIDNSITLYFVFDILFEITLENQYSGTLPNGISIGSDWAEVIKTDPSLVYNDEEEDYISADGYWIVDDFNSKTVASITVFVKEAMDTEEFFRYKWIDNYKRK